MEDDPFIGQKIKSLRRRATRMTADETRRAHAVASYAQSPIGQLATELLTEILALVLVGDDHRTSKSLMEVCRMWEDIIVASPRLNATIKYPMSRKENTDGGQTREGSSLGCGLLAQPSQPNAADEDIPGGGVPK